MEIWGCPSPQKVRIFAWKLATNGLATWDNKFKRNLEVADICVICGVERERTISTLSSGIHCQQIYGGQ
jgi:hypothetical protein